MERCLDGVSLVAMSFLWLRLLTCNKRSYLEDEHGHHESIFQREVLVSLAPAWSYIVNTSC